MCQIKQYKKEVTFQNLTKKVTSSKVTPNLQTQAATTRKRKLAENSEDIQTHDKPELTLQRDATTAMFQWNYSCQRNYQQKP